MKIFYHDVLLAMSAIKAASDIVTSIIMKIFYHDVLLAMILVSSIDLYNISPIKPTLRVEVLVTRWISKFATCLHTIKHLTQEQLS